MEERVWLYAKQVPVLMVLRLPLLVAMNEEPLLDIFLHLHRSDSVLTCTSSMSQSYHLKSRQHASDVTATSFSPILQVHNKI
jgi:hypothetical protein